MNGRARDAYAPRDLGVCDAKAITRLDDSLSNGHASPFAYSELARKIIVLISDTWCARTEAFG